MGARGEGDHVRIDVHCICFIRVLAVTSSIEFIKRRMNWSFLI